MHQTIVFNEEKTSFEMLKGLYDKHKGIIDMASTDNALFKALKDICLDETEKDKKINSVDAKQCT